MHPRSKSEFSLLNNLNKNHSSAEAEGFNLYFEKKNIREIYIVRLQHLS
jgi:hypothetical protein